MFRTNRLLLRRWKPEDRAPFAALNADPVAMQYMPTCLTTAQSDQWVESIETEFEQDGFGLWAVELLEDASFIGFTGLNKVPFKASFTPAVEIGWRLAQKFWGYGFATEAAIAVIQAGFYEYGLAEIVAETATLNLRSRRVMDRAGMRHDPSGDFLHPNIFDGHPLQPHVLYRLQPT